MDRKKSMVNDMKAFWKSLWLPCPSGPRCLGLRGRLASVEGPRAPVGIEAPFPGPPCSLLLSSQHGAPLSYQPWLEWAHMCLGVDAQKGLSRGWVLVVSPWC
jgi:hypothetical protein